MSGREFLVDTGASCSVWPFSSSQRPSGPLLTAADGRRISTWGFRRLHLQFGQRKFSFIFILAAVNKPIVGNDFLAHFSLLVDPANKRVLDAATLQALGPHRAVVAASSIVAALSAASTPLRLLLASFPDVMSPAGFKLESANHGVEHIIETSGRPVFAQARRLDIEKFKVAKEEFRKMEEAGIVRRSSSAWSSPLHMVEKKDGSWRPCGDFRRLNNQTTHDRYPLPNVMDFANHLSGCTVFSTVDLVKGYFQVPMAKEDIQKTAIVTPFGLFEFLRMPFGLKNAAQTFQRLMDRLFAGLQFAFVYLDDILIASRNEVEHLEHLQQILSILSKNGLLVNVDKCHFAQQEVEFLGHQVSATGVQPLVKHVEAITSFVQPADIKQLQRFLGMINFFRRFLPNIAGVLKPLTDALRGNPRQLVWSEEMLSAFQQAKKSLVSAVPLGHPDHTAALALSTDASDKHIGGVLQQWSRGSWQPLAFFSSKLNEAQCKYSAFDRELYAAYATIRHFRFLLEGRKFQLHTDHKPLVAAINRVSPPWSAKQQRHLAYIAEFTSDIRHVPGIVNIVADALSRPSSASLPQSVVRDRSAEASVSGPGSGAGSGFDAGSSPSLHTYSCAAVLLDGVQPVSYLDMAVQQVVCHSVADMKKSTVLKIATAQMPGVLLYGDVSTGVFRPLVPVQLRKSVFDSIHQAAHPGSRATKRLISTRFVWPGLARDVGEWAKNCLGCQKGKVTRHVHLAAEHIPVPARRFAHLHVDLVGPLPPSQQCTHLFTIMDRSTRWFEAYPMKATSAQECAAALFSTWISRFGVPHSITSDRGPQFTSALWASLCKLLNISHQQTTAYHPESNGLVERAHRRLKDALRARAGGPDWVSQLPWVLLGLRSTPREDTNCSAAEAVYGSPLVVPGQFLGNEEPPSTQFFEQLRQSMSAFQPTPTCHNVPADSRPPVDLPADLLQAEFVLVRRDGQRTPLAPIYDGPYKVLQRSLHFFVIKLGERTDTVSVHRLKAAYVPTGVQAALLPRRGRPPTVK